MKIRAEYRLARRVRHKGLSEDPDAPGAAARFASNHFSQWQIAQQESQRVSEIHAERGNDA